MRSFRYENQGAASYLIYEIQEEDVLDNISLNMLSENKVLGIADTSFMQMDDKRMLRYNITAKITADQFFTRQVSKKSFLGILMGITDALISAEAYMIDPQSVILDLSHVFTDVSTGATEMICLPVQGYKTEADPRKFLKEILIGAQFDPSEDGAYVSEILTYLNSVSVFSAEDFKHLLEDILRESRKAKMAREAAEAQSMTEQELLSGHGSGYRAEAPASFRVLPSVVPQPEAVMPEEAAEMQEEIPADIPKEERISLYYLLQHYNGERAKQYMAQRKQLKARKEALKKAKNPGKPKAKEGKDQKGLSFGALIPGKDKKPENNALLSFQIPGKKAPISAMQKKPEENSGVPFALPPRQENAAGSVPGGAPGPSTGKAGSIPQERLNFGETTVLGGEGHGGTTVLNYTTQPDAPRTPCLIRTKNNERIPVNKEIFRLGKERSFVDYLISDNGAVSRSHANILKRGDQYFVVDNNSTNHSFLDGVQLQGNVEKPLRDGSKITLANEEFVFRLL